MQGYPQAGGMTTGIIVGEGINGTTNEYRTSKFNRTGRAGKRTDIGRSSKPGVSRVCNPERDHSSRLKRSNQNLRQNRKRERPPNHNNRDRTPERSSHSDHSRNTGRHHNNLNLDKANLKEGKKKNRTEGEDDKRFTRV